jgi:hypothetical protein
MFASVRPASLTLKAVLLLASIVFVFESGDAPAQVKQSSPAQTAPQKQFFPINQMQLTEKQVRGVLAADEAVNDITDNAEEGGIDKLRPETVAKLDAVVQKHGLASYAEYKQVNENIGLVWSGFDDVTRKYVGRDGLIKLRISRVKADKKISAESRKEKLTDLNDQLQFALPEVQYKGNIDLVAKYYDQLLDTARGD